ncbi:putative ankyrin repeat-containing domain, PGG domain, protein accelerated cell death 6 [Lupinus albus]|uniref:Putative ankyrin repeat-containing domain, PGG domain, protein accelerated cell death 6 n=1 Tax=Lupinus albus TaxID=3870 RepID=A0A6A4R3M8_LUPAL|nr:putative ankyrin repeat-containing domain, PGG domain, protein accelerated cell death 6 [Lupinus albus]
MVSNVAILNEILKRKPELIYLRDEDGGTSLHYAAYIGYVEGVRILLNISTLTALERNTKGDLPIHLACKRGHVEVVEELLQKEWPNPRVFLNYLGQNILHVAAKNGKINVIRYLLRNKKIDWFTLNEKDNNGDTPLHLASRNLFVGVLNEIARDKRIDVNLLNNEGLSAHDVVVLMHSKFPSTIREYLALAILSSAGVPRIKKATSTMTRHKDDGVKDGISTLMLVAILIATVTFVAGFTLPGSVYNLNNPDPHKSCMTGLVDKPMFQVFTICNTISMFSSTIGSFVLLWGQLGDFNLAGSAFIFALQMVGVALMTMSLAFMASLRLVASNFSWLANIITIIGSLFLLLIVLLYILLIFPLKFRHPLILCLASLCIEILILFDGSSDKVMVKFQQNKNSQKVDKGKDQ